MTNLVFPLFEYELIQDIDNLSTTKTFKTGENIIKRSEYVRNVYIILEGCVKAYQENDEGDEFVIAYLKGGNSFGVSISDDSPQFAKIALLSLTAIEPTYVRIMSFVDKDILARKYDRWYKYILQTTAMYYRVYIELVDSIAFQNMDNRIEFFLKRLATVKNTSILQISHQEIAEGLNSSREVVSRLLKKMETCGKIKMSHNTINIL